jgi:hypothetical protein
MTMIEQFLLAFAIGILAAGLTSTGMIALLRWWHAR